MLNFGASKPRVNGGQVQSNVLFLSTFAVEIDVKN